MERLSERIRTERAIGSLPLHCTLLTPGEDGPAAPAAPPVLFLHGFGSDHAATWEQSGWPAALPGRTLIGADLPGHGGSGGAAEAACTPSAVCARLTELLDALGAGAVDVVGYSMGARNAWELALRAPSRVRSAVLGGFGPRDPFAGADLRRLDTDPSPFGELYRAAAGRPGADPEALAACARGQAAEPFAPEPVPAAPLLFAAGERDTIAEGADSLARACGARLVRIPRRSHVSAPAARAFKEAAAAFLGFGPP
ncbi:alpha/beta fold hydrolase [Nocardiopsis coralliicola]